MTIESGLVTHFRFLRVNASPSEYCLSLSLLPWNAPTTTLIGRRHPVGGQYGQACDCHCRCSPRPWWIPRLHEAFGLRNWNRWCLPLFHHWQPYQGEEVNGGERLRYFEDSDDDVVEDVCFMYFLREARWKHKGEVSPLTFKRLYCSIGSFQKIMSGELQSAWRRYWTE